jgi:hypothetical protein
VKEGAVIWCVPLLAAAELVPRAVTCLLPFCDSNMTHALWALCYTGQGAN